MKNLAIASISFFLAAHTFAVPPAGKVRTIENVPGLAEQPLQRMLSPKFYKSLRISPIEGWIMVRGILAGTKVTSAKVVQSDLNGAYDKMAIDIANDWTISGPNPELGSHHPYTPVVVHLLIYQIKDAKMAVSFASLDNPGGNQGWYYGSAWIGILKDGQWKTIKPQYKVGERRP